MSFDVVAEEEELSVSDNCAAVDLVQDINKFVGETARHRVFSIQAGIATTF